MARSSSTKAWKTIAHSVFGVVVLGALNYAGYRLHLNLAAAGFVTLIAIVLLSILGNLISATVLSVVAVAWLDYFFAPPIHSLRVSDPLNALALAAFLATTLVITYLMARLRMERQSSELQRKEMKRLYELAQQLLALTPEEIDTPRLLSLFRDVFALPAICLFEKETAASHLVGEPRYDLAERTRMGYLAGHDRDDALCRISVRCLHTAGQPTGALGFEWPDHQEFTPDALSALETVMLERVRAFQAATQAVATAQADSLRIMLLDALAHAFKTPLATILAAAGGLRETRGITLEHLEFVDVVEAETARLGSLTTRLLRMARLDREEVRPRLQQVDISHLIAEELNLKSQQFTDHKLSLLGGRAFNAVSADGLVRVEADPELLRLALGQLIENACKYSQSGSKIEVSSRADKDSVAIRVWNRGVIPVDEQSKIFNRFYRGRGSRESTSGTGLGLDIARRIAMAHGGTLVLEDTNEGGSTFRITLPVSAKAC